MSTTINAPITLAPIVISAPITLGYVGATGPQGPPGEYGAADATSAATANKLVLRDGTGGANFAGTVNMNIGVITDLQFEDYQAAVGATFFYNTGAASAHRTALGSDATGDALFTAATSGAARTTLGLATTDAVTFANGTFASGSISTSQPLTLTQTWANAAVTYTGMRVNVTDSGPSNAASLLMDLQLAGSSRLSVNKLGLIALPIRGNDGTGMLFGGTSITDAIVYVGQYGLRLSVNRNIEWSSSTHLNNSLDLVLLRDAANTLAQRNGTNAQAFRVYGTFTNVTNYRRVALNMTTAGVASLKPEGLGTGASGNVLHISGLPTSNPGPGILWNDTGTVKVGT